MAKKNDTIEKDRGYRKLLGQIDLLKGAPGVDVGFFAGDDPEGGGENLSIAEYMFVNETGSEDGTIPARPAMADTADTSESEMNALFKKGVIDIARGRATVDSVLAKVGIKYQGILKKAVIAYNTPGNAPSTIEQKGEDNPLFQDGTAVNSIMWEQRKKGE